MRELDGEMHEIKEVCKGIPEAERIAPRRAKEGGFDLTSANAFMTNPQWADNIVTIAKARMGNVETPTGPLVWVVLRTLLHQFAHIHRFWRQKEFGLSEAPLQPLHTALQTIRPKRKKMGDSYDPNIKNGTHLFLNFFFHLQCRVISLSLLSS